jgi:hypothetical protein
MAVELLALVGAMALVFTLPVLVPLVVIRGVLAVRGRSLELRGHYASEHKAAAATEGVLDGR